MQTELQKAKDDRWIGLIPLGLGLVLLIMAASFGGVGWYQYGKRGAMRAWAQVEGAVSFCGYTTARPTGSRTDYYLLTEIAYVVNGTPHTLTERSFLGHNDESLVAVPPPHREGDPLTVFYDPLDPASSALAPVPNGAADYAFLGVMGLCTLLSLPFFWLAVRMLGRAKARLAAAERGYPQAF